MSHDDYLSLLPLWVVWLKKLLEEATGAGGGASINVDVLG